jgi:hypothetical protein
MFRRVFERVVAAGLIGGEGFAVDASLLVVGYVFAIRS